MRVFLGIPVPEELKKKISSVSREIQMKGVKLVEPENLHWTVRFFGELEESSVSKVKETMDLVEAKKMEIELRGAGAFPSERFIKVVWIGVGEGREEFTNLLKEVNKKFSGMGKDSEVVPHLTIGRVKAIRDKDRLARSINKIRNVIVGKMFLENMVLYESTLTGSGPVYREIKRVGLQ